MNRSLIKLLLAIVVAGIFGTLIARDPGYVMISYDGRTLQTGLWVLLGLIAIALFAGFYGWRLIRFLLSSGGLVRAWRSERQKRKSRRMTAQGLAFFNAGAMDRAEKFLGDHAEGADHPAINYLYAGRAADALGHVEDRERYLRLALEADPSWKQAILIAGAEMDLGHGRYKRVLDALADAGESERAVRLKSEAMLALRDWQGLSDLMPSLKKVTKDPNELFTLQREIALERLSAAETDDALAVIFKKQPEAVRHDETVITSYCTRLENETEAELAVRDALKRQWLPHLLALYGSLGEQTLSRRIRTAEGWLKRHSDDAALQLCLGELYEANGDIGKARMAYQKSVDLGGPADASRHLGRLLAFDGKYKESSEQLTRALSPDSR